MPFITTPDGVEIFYKDWGSGQPVVLSHGWPLNSDSWEAQQLYLADNGFRAIAHDRRGHGRSTQVWDGNDMDHYADDLAALIEALDLRDVILVGFSTGGGEVTRYIGRHGTVAGREARAGQRGPAVHAADRGQPGRRADRGLRRHPRRLAGRPLAALPGPRRRRRSSATTARASSISQGIRDAFWRQGLQSGHKNAYDSIAAFSATDMRDDLRQRRRPDARHPRRRRPGRAVHRRRAGVRGAGRRRAAEGLSGRPARHHGHAQGRALRRPARVRARRGRRRARGDRTAEVAS